MPQSCNGIDSCPSSHVRIICSMPAAEGHIFCKLLCRISTHQGGLAIASPSYFGMQLQGMDVMHGQQLVDMSLLKEFLDTKGLWQEFGDFLASKSAQDSE